VGVDVERYARRNGYRRALSGSLEYGDVCPDCASPKTKQALRCMACFVDALRATGREAGLTHISEPVEAEFERLREAAA
jgi:hypothetical protein